MNHSKFRFPIGSFFACFLSLMFSGIVFFSLFAIAQIQNYKSFAAVIIFSSINLIILFLLALFGNQLSQTMPTASFISICSVTMLYTVLQFVHLGLNFKDYTNGYILYHIILLFIYFLIVIPAALIGIRKE